MTERERLIEKLMDLGSRLTFEDMSLLSDVVNLLRAERSEISYSNLIKRAVLSAETVTHDRLLQREAFRVVLEDSLRRLT